MFELANEMLPLMELHHFGTIPILEKFNSHVLSEIGFSFIYYLVNGTSGYEMVVYNFFIFAMYYLVIYYFFLYYFKHWYLSFLICLVFPLAAGAIPFFHAMGLIALFVLLKLLSKKQNYVSYLVFILGLFFVLIWRIDTGYASIAAIAVMLLSFVLHKQTNVIKWKLFFKTAIGFVLISIILLWVIGVVRNFQLQKS